MSIFLTFRTVILAIVKGNPETINKSKRPTFPFLSLGISKTTEFVEPGVESLNSFLGITHKKSFKNTAPAITTSPTPNYP
jgi:hypothetical protein